MAAKKTKPTLEEIDYRTRLANCEALEIKVSRERFELDNKRGELCRIDTALHEFDGFLREFVGLLVSNRVQQITAAVVITLLSAGLTALVM